MRHNGRLVVRRCICGLLHVEQSLRRLKSDRWSNFGLSLLSRSRNRINFHGLGVIVIELWNDIVATKTRSVREKLDIAWVHVQDATIVVHSRQECPSAVATMNTVKPRLLVLCFGAFSAHVEAIDVGLAGVVVLLGPTAIILRVDIIIHGLVDAQP